MVTKVYGKKDDKIKILEKISLNGENARSVIKSRLAITDNAESEFRGITEGHAPRARGTCGLHGSYPGQRKSRSYSHCTC